MFYIEAYSRDFSIKVYAKKKWWKKLISPDVSDLITDPGVASDWLELKPA